MAMQLACPQCGKLCRVPDSYAGRHIDCRGCGTVFEAALPVGTAIPIDDAETAPFHSADASPLERRGPSSRGGMSPGLLWGLIGGGIGLSVLLVVVVLIVALRDARANVDNFQRVRQGMTEKEVIAIMGPPTRVVGIGFAKSMVWSTPTHEFVVSMVNDQVAMTAAVAHNGNQPALNFPGGNAPNINFPNVNVGNPVVNLPNVGGGRDWNQLKVGMTEKEVVDRFGAPALTMDCDVPKLVFAGVTENEVRAAHNNQMPPVKLLTYMDVGQLAHYKVTLVDGKVFKVRKL